MIKQGPDCITEAVQSLGLFKDTTQPPLRDYFADWLVDALTDPDHVRHPDSYGSKAWRNPNDVPWAEQLV